MENLVRGIVKDLIIFHGLSEDEITRLIGKLSIRSCKAGDTVIREGEVGSELGIIIIGKVGVYKTGKTGNELKINELVEKESFGEMTLIDVQKRSATIRALTDAVVAVLDWKDLMDFYNEDIRMYTMIILNIAREFSRRIRKLDEKLLELVHLAVKDGAGG